MAQPTYKRGQVEWALWRAVTRTRGQKPEPPSIFRTRIKRLLDIDREQDVGEGWEIDPETRAFAEAAEPGMSGRGVETHYSGLDAFCLAIALDLLDVGFKQGEIVMLMRYLRASLDDRIEDLVRRPSLIDRKVHRAVDFPDLPAVDRGPGLASVVDARVFLLLNRIEMTESLSVPPASGERSAVFLKPEFADGVVALQAMLGRLMPDHRRAMVVLEIAAAAQAVVFYLQQAPLLARGRPPKRADG